MKIPDDLPEAAWFAVVGKLVPAVIFAGAAVLAALLIFSLQARGVDGAANYGGVVFLLGIVGAIFSKLVIWKMEKEKTMSASEASAHVFYTWVMYLHFVPGLGTLLSSWAEAKKRSSNPFVESDHNHPRR